MSETASDRTSVPQHVAIIMDGNGRWAQQRGRPRTFGHSKGVEAVRRVVEAAGDRGVRTLTLFSFSTENWNRPADEVGALFELMKRYVAADLASLKKKGVRIRIIGRRDDLTPDLAEIVTKAETDTAENTDFNLNIAFNYGGRDELIRAAQSLAEAVRAGDLNPSDIDEGRLSAALDTAGLPDVDLMIRTSGEQRISNFLLWQAAYAEFYFTDVLWPDFDDVELGRALDSFQQRDRRYGGVDAGAA
ncbi:MAG: isoprenyl transferase [Maricaulis sp.]|uniref:isoprenyl transferase n=1 Tax=Maricaulis sp. TaxID=1486257 RepID=UPI001B180606|nr:isoprenyl transferase [Maricaulis sp.]MBO6728147.1 isoprenyl transferase [Maricaulis sp.]MBO6846577.1 isoprenyl transferase [Maricaulis sp.]MBO6877186.1 isoprenyl transferase [Maricaulis sp.]